METEHRELNPEQLKKLQKAGILGLDQDDEILHVPAVYREDPELFPKEMWPVFKLKPLDGVAQAKLEAKLGHMEVEDGKDDDSRVTKWISRNGPTRIEILQTHILGWKNHCDKNGKEIEFRVNGSKVKLESLGTLRPALQTELFNAITEGSDASKEELEGLDF